MPLLVHDILRYYRDQLVLEPDCEELCLSREDERVLSFYKENLMEVTDENGQRRLQLPFPWKVGYPVDMPQSLPIAMRCLRLQSNKLAQQPELSQKYIETFENMKRNGHVESINENESRENEQNPIHYISHFSTGQKFRVVYDSALRINGISINDMLYRGPMFLESLVGILIRSRQHAFGVTGDIRNMFFQVKLHIPEIGTCYDFCPSRTRK